MQDAPTIGIIGAGFSGTLLAVHLLRLAPPNLRILLIERDLRFGRGLAFSTSNQNHVLNVRAENMSAFPDQPSDFVAWLRSQAEPGELQATDGPLFASRGLYGSYVQHCLSVEMKRRAETHNLFLLNDEAVRLVRGERGLDLTLFGGRTYRLDIAVLAVGNLPPEAPVIADSQFLHSPLYRPDPWDPGAFDGLGPDDSVFLIGTGLSMVDVVVSLIGRGHRGPIHALSRHGLIPRRHAQTIAYPTFELDELPTTIRALTRFVRARIAGAERAGRDWRSVIDALRPISQALWTRLPLDQRARFLRHLRSWWDVHRHRMAPNVAQLIHDTIASGQLQIHAGRIKRIEQRRGSARIIFRPRGARENRAMQAAIVVNCSGPGCDFTRVQHTLVRQMLEDGLIRPDPLSLGLDISLDGLAVNHDGRVSDDIFALGPLTKATYGEITAVPDIRSQCARLAGTLVARMATRCAESAELVPAER